MKKICFKVQIACPKKILEALKDPILEKQCHYGRWFLEIQKEKIKFLYSRPCILVGVFIDAEVINDKDGKNYSIKKICINPQLRYTNPKNEDKDIRTTEEIAKDIINECFKGIIKKL